MKSSPSYYLDHAATSPLRPEARKAMQSWLDAGNASSQHAWGRKSRAAIDAARESVAASMHREFADVVFTSGGTEAAVLGIVGGALGNAGRSRVLMAANEHHCVLHCEPLLRRLGFRVDLIPVNGYGRVDPRPIENDVALVAVMHANNETGVVNPIEEWQWEATRSGAVLFTDAIQTYGRRNLPDADFIAVSAHKLGGPKGIGALAVRPGTKLEAIHAGGGQERERRGGTENVAAIVGFGAVVASPSYGNEGTAIFRQRLLESGAVPTLSKDVESLSNIVHVSFPGLRADTLLVRLDRMGVAASAGAACSSGSLEPSHVLLASGLPEEAAWEGVRFSFRGDESTEFGNEAAELVLEAVKAVRTR